MNRIGIAALAHVLAFTAAYPMPADSTAYYKLGSVPMLDFCCMDLRISQMPVTQDNFTALQMAIHSNPDGAGQVNVDIINRSAGTYSSKKRDRGGMAFTVGTQLRYWAGYIPWDDSRRSHFEPGLGYFNEPAYSVRGPRGWAKIGYRYSLTSTGQMTQPYAVRKKAIAVGGFSTKSHEVSRTTREIPLGPLGLSSNRVMSLQYLNNGFKGVDPFNDCNGPHRDLYKQTSAGPAGMAGGSGVAIPVTLNGSKNALVMNFNTYGRFDCADHKNRGFVLLDYLAAECNDGTDVWSGANVGSRTVQAYVNQATALSSYAGCHGTNAGTHVIENSGDDIWGTGSDAFRYAYKSGSGNKNLILRVDQLENTNAWARAGIMLRENTTAGSRNAAVFVTGGNGIIFQARTGTNGTTAAIGTATGIKAPIWLRLEYANGTTRAYRSSNGTSWTQIGNGSVASYGGYLYGMAAASRSNYPNTSVYSSLNF